MIFSLAGKTLLKKWEKLELKAYPDQNVPPVWTIGYGHTVGTREGMIWTQDECERVLDSDIGLYSAKVATLLVRCPVKLTDNQFSAFVCFTFNIGITAFVGTSALRNCLVGRTDLVPDAMRLWNKVTINGSHVVSNGLMNRREAEVVLWNTP